MMTTDDLRAWRARRRWSQEQAADALGYSRRGYQDAENRPSGEAITSRLEERVRAFDAPVRSMEGTTLGDLSDEHNAREARIELERAASDADFAKWARRWGACCMTRVDAVLSAEENAEADLKDDYEEQISSLISDLDSVQKELDEANDDNEFLRLVARDLIDEINSAPDIAPLPKPVEAAIVALEKIL